MRRLLTAMSCISLMFVGGCGSDQGQDSATTEATVTETVTVTATPDLDEFYEDLYDENAGQEPDGVLSTEALPEGLDVAGDGQLWAFFSEAGAVGVFRAPSQNSELCETANDFLQRSYEKNSLGDLQPYGCISVAIDNSDGTEDVDFDELTMIDTDGDTCESVRTWSEPGFNEGDHDLHNDSINLYNENLGTLRPGAEGEETLFFKELPDDQDISRIFVNPGGFAEVEALLVE